MTLLARFPAHPPVYGSHFLARFALEIDDDGFMDLSRL